MNFTTTRAIDRFGELVTARKGNARRITLYFPIGIVYGAKELRQARMEFVGRPYPGNIGVDAGSSMVFTLVRRATSRYADEEDDSMYDRLADASQAINSYVQLRVGNSVDFAIREADLGDTESVYLRVVADGSNVNTSIWYHVDSLLIGLNWWDGEEDKADKPTKPTINFETVKQR